jgi:potassium-transporting ATPase KdpC subunit
MWRQMLPALRMLVVLTILTGLVYPLAVTGLAQVLLRDKADGSLVVRDSKVIGSELIGQSFAGPTYFHPRPSAAGDGYDAANSGGSNLGPTSRKLMDRVKASVDQFREENPDFQGPIPADLLTTSASGLDPHISPASAAAQIERVAKARGLPVDRVQTVVAENTQGRDWGFLGEPRVNVLLLNLALDSTFPQQSTVQR